jgi:hypothetical protein
MPQTLHELTSEVLKLPEDNRAQLAEILLDSLRGPEPGSLQEERLVLEEAVRRDEDLASGSVKGRSWKDVLAAARARLR